MQALGYLAIKQGFVVLYRSIFDVVRDFLHDEAVEGQDGLAQALQDGWDVIVCDVQIPGLSGLDLYDRLEQERPGDGRRVVLISGDTTTPAVAEFCRRTGLTVLAKPFELSHFAEAVERAAAPTEAA